MCIFPMRAFSTFIELKRFNIILFDKNVILFSELVLILTKIEYVVC